MSKEMSIIVLGVWIVVATQLGIPFHPWLVGLFVLTGIAIAIIGLLMRGEALARGGSNKNHSFVENTPSYSEPTPSSHEENIRVQ